MILGRVNHKVGLHITINKLLKFRIEICHICFIKLLEFPSHWLSDRLRNKSTIQLIHEVFGFICAPNMIWMYIVQLHIRCLLRFEYQLPHPILCTTLATDKKWPSSHFHISYQNSEISWPKMGLILVNKVL